MQRLKLLVALVFTGLLVLLILQNTEPVQTRLLFVTVTMPRAALLFFAGLSGFIVGLMAALRFERS